MCKGIDAAEFNLYLFEKGNILLAVVFSLVRRSSSISCINCWPQAFLQSAKPGLLSVEIIDIITDPEAPVHDFRRA